MKKIVCTIASVFLLLGSVKQATAQTGQALNLDGSNDYAMTSANITHGNQFTYEAWINTTSANAWGGIMTTSTLGSQPQWVQLTLNGAGALRVEIADDASNSKWYEGVTNLVGAWHHVAITFDGTSLLFYVDGNTETTSAINNGTLGTMTINSQLNIGAERDHADFFNGSIDAARVWNVARTQAQIQSTMHVELTSAQAGLIANYNFDEGIANGSNPTVTTLTDASGSGLDATLNNFTLSGNASNWVAPGATGLQGAALKCSGTNQVNIGNSMNAVLGTLNSITVEAWINVSDTLGAAYNEIIGNYSSPANQMQFLLRKQQGKISFVVNTGGANQTTTTGGGVITLNTWMHIAGVWDGSNLYIYINGVLKATQTGITGTHLNSTVTNSVVIGYETAGSGEPLNGSVDEARIWTRALCQDEIQNNMNGELSLPQTGLLAYYQFNEGISGANNAGVTTLNDISGNGYNGTLNGFTLNGTTSNWIAPGGVTTGVNAPAFVSPVINVSGTNPICIGTTTTLTASGNVTTYTWTAGPTTAAYAVTPTVNTTYSVVGTNSVGCNSNMVVTTVTVNTLPNITLAAANNPACAGTTNTLTATGAVSYTYTPNLGTHLGVIVANTPASNFTISTMGTDANGCINTSPVFTLNVNSLPALIVFPASPNICIGNTATLSVSGANTYTWSTTQTTASITASPTVTTNYTVTGTDVNNCVNMAVATVTVNSLPTVVVNSEAICTGSTATLTATGADTYTWSTTETTTTINPAPTAAITDYTVTGTDVNNCVNMAVATVTVNSLPTLTVTVNTATICAGTMDTINVSGTATSYIWNTTETTMSVTPTPSMTTTYTVTGTDANACVNTATATINVNSLPTLTVTVNTATICAGTMDTINVSGTATSYIWNTTETTMSITPTPSMTTTYTVTGTDANACVNTATATINVNSLPTLTVTVNTATICAGTMDTLSVSGTATSYIWNTTETTMSVTPTPSMTTTYTVTGTDVNGCMNMATASINVNALPVITISDASICAGGSFTISPSGVTSFTVSGGSSVITPTATASYSITGTDANGCVTATDAVMTVTVNTLPTLTVTPNDTTICPGASVTLNANGATSYTWSTTETTGSIVATPTANATYSVSGTDANDCTGMSSTSVTVTVCTGIAKYSNNINVSVYPNPSKGEFTIASANYAENTTLTIYNAIGQAVYTTKLNSALQTINANLANGMYVIRLQNAQGTGTQHIVITE